MATLKQMEANRRNARKSTGPKTPEGKAKVRLNALQHGLTASATVLPFEDPEAFAGLCADLEAEWRPQTPTEIYYLEVMAVSRWKQARAEQMLAKICHSLELAPAAWQMLEQVQKQQARLQRAHDKAQHELQALLKERHARPSAGEAAADALVDQFLQQEAAHDAEYSRLLRERTLQLREARERDAAAGKTKNQSQFARPESGAPAFPES